MNLRAVPVIDAHNAIALQTVMTKLTRKRPTESALRFALVIGTIASCLCTSMLRLGVIDSRVSQLNASSMPSNGALVYNCS